MDGKFRLPRHHGGRAGLDQQTHRAQSLHLVELARRRLLLDGVAARPDLRLGEGKQGQIFRLRLQPDGQARSLEDRAFRRRRLLLEHRRVRLRNFLESRHSPPVPGIRRGDADACRPQLRPRTERARLSPRGIRRIQARRRRSREGVRRFRKVFSRDREKTDRGIRAHAGCGQNARRKGARRQSRALARNSMLVRHARRNRKIRRSAREIRHGGRREKTRGNLRQSREKLRGP